MTLDLDGRHSISLAVNVPPMHSMQDFALSSLANSLISSKKFSDDEFRTY